MKLHYDGKLFILFSFLLSFSFRELPYLSLKCFGYVIVGSLFFKIFWQFVPFFIADCIFYWMLYVSPFDALNRLLKTIWSYWRQAPTPPAVGDVNPEPQGWNFNFEWNTNRWTKKENDVILLLKTIWSFWRQTPNLHVQEASDNAEPQGRHLLVLETIWSYWRGKCPPYPSLEQAGMENHNGKISTLNGILIDKESRRRYC